MSIASRCFCLTSYIALHLSLSAKHTGHPSMLLYSPSNFQVELCGTGGYFRLVVRERNRSNIYIYREGLGVVILWRGWCVGDLSWRYICTEIYLDYRFFPCISKKVNFNLSVTPWEHCWFGTIPNGVHFYCYYIDHWNVSLNIVQESHKEG